MVCLFICMIELNLKNKLNNLKLTQTGKTKLVNYPIFNWPQLPYPRSKFCVLPTVRKVTKFSRILVFKVSPDFI
jgi:hypothetical protein